MARVKTATSALAAVKSMAVRDTSILRSLALKSALNAQHAQRQKLSKVDGKVAATKKE